MLDWLGKIIPKHIHVHLSVSPKLVINNVKIEAKPETKEPVIIDGDKLIINDATKEGAEIADNAIKALPSNLEHNDIVLEEANLENLEAIDKDIKESDYNKQLERFRGIVPRADWPILEAAILIAIRYKRGENISRMKAQIVARYGARGAMISNLYSSGYFESLIQPLHTSISEGSLAMDEYLDLYEMVVTESPLAMFVGVGSTKSKIKTTLLEKIKYNQANEVGYLNIHGIGASNIKVIKSLMDDPEICQHFIEDPVIKQVDKSVKATIFIKDRTDNDQKS